IIKLNRRYDASSRFPKNNRCGFFLSGSVVRRLQREAFITLSGLDLVNRRASYMPDDHQSGSSEGHLPASEKKDADYLFGSERGIFSQVPSLVSTNYTWEKVNSINVGMDVGVLKNKLSASFDYYSRRTLGMLTLRKDLPNMLGAAEPRENAAD